MRCKCINKRPFIVNRFSRLKSLIGRYRNHESDGKLWQISMFKNQLCFTSLKFGLAVLTSVFVVNSAIVTLQSTSADTAEAARKEKRGIYGFGVHGHHHNHQPYDDYPPHPSVPHHHNAPSPPLPPPVNLGAHFHTTITKKIGVPIPYPYPVKVRYLRN